MGKEEMRLYKIQAFKEMKRKEMEEMKKNGWMVLTHDENFNVDADVHVVDVSESLEGEEKEKFTKAMAALTEKLEAKQNQEKESTDKDSSSKAETKDGVNEKTVKKVVNDEDFQKYF